MPSETHYLLRQYQGSYDNNDHGHYLEYKQSAELNAAINNTTIDTHITIPDKATGTNASMPQLYSTSQSSPGNG